MTRTEAHPIEVLLVVALLALEAAVTITAALVALLLTVARWRPQASPIEGNTTAPSGNRNPRTGDDTTSSTAAPPAGAQRWPGGPELP